MLPENRHMQFNADIHLRLGTRSSLYSQIIAPEFFPFPLLFHNRMFFKIKSRNAHMKTHRQQEEQQRQKAQKAAVAAEMAATIARTTGPAGHSLIPLDHLDLIKQVEQAEGLDSDVVQELGEVIDSTDVIDPDLLLDEEDTELLQDDVEL